jgi:hypothetical protein
LTGEHKGDGERVSHPRPPLVFGALLMLRYTCSDDATGAGGLIISLEAPD